MIINTCFWLLIALWSAADHAALWSAADHAALLLAADHAALLLAAHLDSSEEQSSEGLDGVEEFVDGEAAAVLTQVDGQIHPLFLHRRQQLLQLLTHL